MLLLAQAGELAKEVTAVIDARVVGALGILILVVLVPALKWLAERAVTSAFDKITGLTTQVSGVITEQEKARARQDDHGRKLDGAKSVAEQAHTRAIALEPRLGTVEGKIIGIEKDISRVDSAADLSLDVAKDAAEKAQVLGKDLGKVETRLERVEKDVDKNTEKVSALDGDARSDRARQEEHEKRDEEAHEGLRLRLEKL